MAATGHTMMTPGANLIYNPESRTCFTVVDPRRQHVTYFWDTVTPQWGELDAVADLMGFPHDCASWSRLSKWVYQEHVTREISGIKPHRDFRLMSEKKFFWHFHKIVEGNHGNCTELDVKGAYARSITREESLYLEAPFRPRPDNGAMERFKALVPILPKKMRLCLIGYLASGKMTQFYLDPARPGSLSQREIRMCYDGGVFNRIHASLAGLYSFMHEMEMLAHDDCVRVHTDSLLIKESLPDAQLNAMLRLAKKEGYELACKGHGNAVLFNLNEGVLGGRIIGNPRLILRRWDAYIKGIEREMERVAKLDVRLEKLPYKNERYSLSQAREIIYGMPQSVIIR